MPDSFAAAAIQMPAQPGDRSSRLARAAHLIESAVVDGAQLVVLPAQFNTGKTFLETTYETTERLAGHTLQWCREQAQRHAIYLAGSWLLADHEDTYHAAFLVAPDGQYWRYDQNYPYLWERVFYRDGERITIADTPLGKIGFMIGWDVAHADLWARYAGKIDLLLIFDSSPNYAQAQLAHPTQPAIAFDEFNGIARWLLSRSVITEPTYHAQAQWLHVPIISAGASGTFDSLLPAPFFSVGSLLWGNTQLSSVMDRDYAALHLSAPMQPTTYIRSIDNRIDRPRTHQEDAIVQSLITLSDTQALPLDLPQPSAPVAPSVSLLADSIANGLFAANYRRGVRRQWGATMARRAARTRTWTIALVIVAILSALLSRVLSPKRQ